MNKTVKGLNPGVNSYMFLRRRLSIIVQVNVFLNRTVVDSD